jgi:trimethylamine--corrinoid protein Co-methyltransferase
MRLLGIRDVLTPGEVETFHRGALRIIDRVGLKIENAEMLRRLADFGGRVDLARERVTFAPAFVEEFLASRKRASAPAAPPDRPEVTLGTGSLCLNYEDPETGEVRKFTTQDFIDSCRLCERLPRVKYVGNIGIPQDFPQILAPLHIRRLLWRHTERAWGNTWIVWDNRVSPYILELVQAYCEAERKDFSRVMRVTNFLVSPFRYPREEAGQFVWWWKKGIYFHIDHMQSAGGSAPVTLAGTVVLWLAESMMLNIIYAAFYGRQGLYMGAALAPMDMRRGTYPYGRPEQALMSLASSQLIRHYGGEGGSGAGHGTCAKATDYEAGLQIGYAPALNMVFNGELSAGSGVYSVDEVFSPVQLIIDNEWAAHMERLARPVEVTEESLALDVIEEVGPGGAFTGTTHTAERFRDELWMPGLFSWENWESWRASGGRPLREKAREVVREALADSRPCGMKPETERALASIVERARKKLVG